MPPPCWIIPVTPLISSYIARGIYLPAIGPNCFISVSGSSALDINCHSPFASSVAFLVNSAGVNPYLELTSFKKLIAAILFPINLPVSAITNAASSISPIASRCAFVYCQRIVIFLLPFLLLGPNISHPLWLKSSSLATVFIPRSLKTSSNPIFLFIVSRCDPAFCLL